MPIHLAPRLPTEARQAEIVAAALQLAREASPPLITTAEIAAVVGVSQGAVFKHFASKDAIWQAVMSWVHVQLLAALEAAAAGVAQPLQALEAVFGPRRSAVTWRWASTPTPRPRSSSARCRAWSCRP